MLDAPASDGIGRPLGRPKLCAVPELLSTPAGFVLVGSFAEIRGWGNFVGGGRGMPRTADPQPVVGERQRAEPFRASLACLEPAMYRLIGLYRNGVLSVGALASVHVDCSCGMNTYMNGLISLQPIDGMFAASPPYRFWMKGIPGPDGIDLLRWWVVSIVPS